MIHLYSFVEVCRVKREDIDKDNLGPEEKYGQTIWTTVGGKKTEVTGGKNVSS